QRGHHGDRQARPTHQLEAPRQPVGDGGEVDGKQDGDEDQQQDVDHPDDEPDGQGRNEERHERGARQPGGGRAGFSAQRPCSASSSSTMSASLAPLPSAFASGAEPAGRRPIFCFSAISCSSALAFTSRPWNCFIRLSPESSSFTSAAAMSLRSSCSICSAIRSKVSKALLSEIEDIVSWMRLCASARFWRATRMFFLRFASSILSLRARSEALSLSVSSRCLTHVSCSWTAPCTCSLCRSSACLARSSRPSCTARTARFS